MADQGVFYGVKGWIKHRLYLVTRVVRVCSVGIPLWLGACTTTSPYLATTQWQGHVLSKTKTTPNMQVVSNPQQWQSMTKRLQEQGWQPIALTKVTQPAQVVALLKQDPSPHTQLRQFAMELRAQQVLVLAQPNTEVRVRYFVRKPRLLLTVEPTTVPETGLTGLLIITLEGDWAIPSGLLKGDVILAVEGNTTTKPEHLANTPAKKTFHMTLLRFGKIEKHTIYVP